MLFGMKLLLKWIICRLFHRYEKVSPGVWYCPRCHRHIIGLEDGLR